MTIPELSDPISTVAAYWPLLLLLAAVCFAISFVFAFVLVREIRRRPEPWGRRASGRDGDA